MYGKELQISMSHLVVRALSMQRSEGKQNWQQVIYTKRA
jgi:hypothetical protein